MTSRRPKISIHEKAEVIDRDRDLWRCRECEQELKGTSGVHNHYYDQHRGLAPPLCKDCDITTTTDRALRRHSGLIHTRPDDEHDRKQRECRFCENAWPLRPGDHTKDCPKPEGRVRDGWDLDKSTGKYRRIVHPLEVATNEKPDFDHGNPRIEVPRSPSFGSDRALRQSQRAGDITSSTPRSHSIQQARLARPPRQDLLRLRRQRASKQSGSEQNSSLASHLDLSLPSSYGLPPHLSHSSVSPDSTHFVDQSTSTSAYAPHSPPFSRPPNHLLQTLPWNNGFPVQDPMENSPSSTFKSSDYVQLHQRAPYRSNPFFVNSSHPHSQYDPTLLSYPSQAEPYSEPVNKDSQGPSQIDPSLIDPRLTATPSRVESSHNFQPRHSLGNARTSLTHRQALRYHDLVVY